MLLFKCFFTVLIVFNVLIKHVLSHFFLLTLLPSYKLRELISSFIYKIAGIVSGTIYGIVLMLISLCDVLHVKFYICKHLFFLFLSLLGKNKVGVKHLILVIFYNIVFLTHLAMSVKTNSPSCEKIITNTNISWKMLNKL